MNKVINTGFELFPGVQEVEMICCGECMNVFLLWEIFCDISLQSVGSV